MEYLGEQFCYTVTQTARTATRHRSTVYLPKTTHRPLSEAGHSLPDRKTVSTRATQLEWMKMGEGVTS